MKKNKFLDFVNNWQSFGLGFLLGSLFVSSVLGDLPRVMSIINLIIVLILIFNRFYQIKLKNKGEKNGME
jgi:hypothetical protein